MSSIAATLSPTPWRHFNSRPDLRLVLAVAVALHVLLLLLPVSEERPIAMPRSVAVDLQALQPAQTAVEPIPETIPEPESVPRPVEQVVPVPPAQATPAKAKHSETERPPGIDQQRPVTTAYLLESANYFRLPVNRTQPAERIPGVPLIPALPANLTRPVLPLSDTVFEEPYISGETEMIDQWISPDGVVEAVVRAPNGDFLCGRMEPYNVMNPLVEHVAMWRGCGGGGKRKAGTASPFRLRD